MPDPSGRDDDQLDSLDAGLAAVLLVWSRAQEGLGTRVSPSQLRALLVVDRHGEINVNGLAVELGAVPSSASRLCDRLAAAGLLRRESSPHSRRAVLLRLTGDGQRLLAELAAARRADLAEVLARMSPAGRAGLLAGVAEFGAVAHGDVADGGSTAGACADRDGGCA